jgi:hypothetical protein
MEDACFSAFCTEFTENDPNPAEIFEQTLLNLCFSVEADPVFVDSRRRICYDEITH